MDTQKQQVAERIKQANNILVTVSTNPSVDQLAACIGLTLSLNKMGKHATAVFSGAIPSTIEFLQPEKTIEKNTDSLRDFIIALDKAKADKLRYKVEDRVVKIFITPYRTSISDKDLEYSQGDFNVDVVLALGVHAQTDLDQAITSHGRILHDATVVTLNVRSGGELGSLNWVDPNASSLSELTVQLIDMLDKKLIDGQIATAMLTGIVAETDRFSNAKTSSQTMSISAELMAVGANQQLVATKLEEPLASPSSPTAPIAQQDAHKDGATDLPAAPKKPDDGTLEITHDGKPADKQATGTLAGGDTSPPAESPILPPPSVPAIHDIKSDASQANGELPQKEGASPDLSSPWPGIQADSELEVSPPKPAPVPPPQIHIDEHGSLSPAVTENNDIDAADEAALLSSLKPQEPPKISHHSEAPKMILEPPTLGGQLTANATSDALNSTRSDDEEDAAAGMPGMPAHEMPMLRGEQPTSTPTAASMLPAANEEANAPGTNFLGDQPLKEPASKPVTPGPGETLSEIERDVHSSHLTTTPATEPSYIETPLPPSAPTPAPVPPVPQSQPPGSMPPQVQIVAPDDLTPEEVATAMGTDATPATASLAGATSPPAMPTPETSQPPLTVAEQATADYGNLDNARDAVAQAINGSVASSPASVQALNTDPLSQPAGNANQQAGATPIDQFAASPMPQAPVQPWNPPVSDSAPQPESVNPATQFDPAAFGGQENDPNAPPPVPPPMMPTTPMV